MLPTFDITRVAYGDKPLQFGELYTPAGTEAHPVVVLIHGGFWRNAYGLALMRDLAQDLVRRGIVVWNIEYRRVGDASGGWPETLLDVARAVDYLRQLQDTYALDLQRVVPVGHSAGGHLALWLAARHKLTSTDLSLVSTSPLPLTAAVSLAGAMDLEHVRQLHLGNDAALELLGGDPDSVPERYLAASPTAHLPLGIPQVLVHGTADDRVPLIVSRSYTDKARAAGDSVTLIELADTDHFALIDSASAAWSMTVQEINRLLV